MKTFTQAGALTWIVKSQAKRYKGRLLSSIAFLKEPPMFDTNDKGERSRKAYREGAEASKSSGFWGHFWHEFDDAVKPFFPQSAESKARDAGWHDYSDKKYRYNRRKKNGRSSQSSSSSGESNSHGIVALIGIAIVIGVVVWLGSTPIERHQPNQEVWTMRRVKAVKLNIRSAPGVQSPIVAAFEQGWRIAVTGEPVKEGNSLWVRVSSDDGRIQGWANQSYIDYGPYDQSVETTIASQEKTEEPALQESASASTSSSNELLKVTPYEQSEPKAPTTDSKPGIKVSSNMRVLSDEPQNSATPATTTTSQSKITVPRENENSEPSSDGIPRLKKRDDP
jgi:hypothetical protein